MAAVSSSDPMHSGMHESGSYKQSNDKHEDNSARWYFSRKEIEENSPSRSDGIDLKKETYFCKSYCTFLQDLGMRLKVPQKGKVEETPRPLKDVILVSYEINNKKDPEAVQRIKQKEVYEQQKELILIGERVVLATLVFDFNVNNPYKPLVEAINKFKVAQDSIPQVALKALAQVAWNFVNDGLRTSLCLQFKPHHIAAGAIFLAAKFLKVKLPSDGEKVWWQEFNVTPRQLEEVSNQMLELYEQNRMPASQTSEVLDGSTGGGVVIKKPRAPAVSQEHTTKDSDSHVGPTTSRSHTSNPTSSSRQISHHPKTSQDQSNDDGSTDRNKDINSDVDNNSEMKDHGQSQSQILEYRSQTPKDGVKKIDKDKVRAALEKRKKARSGDVARRNDSMDDDDLIERELEDGIELANDSENNKQESKQNSSKYIYNKNNDNDFDSELVEEGEVGALDDDDIRHRSSSPVGRRKRRRN